MTLDPVVRSAVWAAVRFNEIGPDPNVAYCLSWAGKGNSGASFGAMQNDLHERGDARDVMRALLFDCAPPGTLIGGIMARLMQRAPQNNLPPQDFLTVNAVLASPKGRAAVDALDQRTFGSILSDLDICRAAAAQVGATLSTAALCYAGCWVNMTGFPGQLCTWLKGTPFQSPAGDVPAPGPGEIGAPSIAAYLQAQAYYRENPQNWRHIVDAVAVGMTEAARAA